MENQVDTEDRQTELIKEYYAWCERNEVQPGPIDAILAQKDLWSLSHEHVQWLNNYKERWYEATKGGLLKDLENEFEIWRKENDLPSWSPRKALSNVNELQLTKEQKRWIKGFEKRWQKTEYEDPFIYGQRIRSHFWSITKIVIVLAVALIVFKWGFTQPIGSILDADMSLLIVSIIAGAIFGGISGAMGGIIGGAFSGYHDPIFRFTTIDSSARWNVARDGARSGAILGALPGVFVGGVVGVIGEISTPVVIILSVGILFKVISEWIENSVGESIIGFPGDFITGSVFGVIGGYGGVYIAKIILLK